MALKMHLYNSKEKFMKKIRKGLMTFLVLTLGIFLTTGCSGTKELTGSIPTSPNNLSSTITGFDFFKKNGNEINYTAAYFDSNENLISVNNHSLKVINTDLVSSNLIVNHSIHSQTTDTYSTINNYSIQTNDGFYVYNQTNQTMLKMFPFPLNHDISSLVYFGEETINTAFGTLTCTKVKWTNPSDQSYTLIWLDAKYFTVKQVLYSPQGTKLIESYAVTANY